MSTPNAVQTVNVEASPQGLRRRPRKPELLVDPLKAERVQETLRAAPAWRLFPGATTLQKVKEFPTSMAALLYSSFISSLASSCKVPVLVRFDGLRVTVTLTANGRQGCGALSDEQLGFAVMIS